VSARLPPRPQPVQRDTHGLGQQIDAQRRAGEARDRSLGAQSVSLRGRQILDWDKATADAAAADVTARYRLRVPSGLRVISAHWLTDDPLTADNSNYAEIALVRVRPDGTETQLARTDTRAKQSGGSGDWIAGQAIELAVSQARCDPGDRLRVDINKVGAGVVVGAGLLQAVYQYVS